MTRPAYYNENNPKAAATLRELINAGHIAPGIVDERSIEDVYPSDLRGFTQCHFFAGIGVWSYALRLAGWSDDRPVWTGSCPCQPFSAAGAGAGFADERHLWPAWHHLVGECRPADLFGEQVASKDADPWIDLVHTDMEALGYAFGAVPFPSAGVGAPHIRDRLYWVANASLRGKSRGVWQRGQANRAAWTTGGHGAVGELDHPDHARLAGYRRDQATGGGAQYGVRPKGEPTRAAGHSGGLGHANGERAGRDGRSVFGALCGEDGQYVSVDADASGRLSGMADPDFARFCGEQGLRIFGADFHDADGRRPVSGFWAGADWIPCRDGKWRPVEPGTSPLAHGAPERVGRLHGCGNAINAKAAQAFIEAVMEAEAA